MPGEGPPSAVSPRPGPTRRRFLAGGLALTAVSAGALAGSAAGLLPGRIRTRRLLGLGERDRRVPDVAAGDVVRGGFASAGRGRDVGWSRWTPPGLDAPARGELPIVLVLHGRGADHRTAFDVLGWHRFAAAAFGAGSPPFALVSVDGGDRYWHPRADGDDPLRMITHELLPRAHAAGVGGPGSATAVWGWSMGGFGGLTLAREAAAGRLRGPDGDPLRLAAVAACSPALFDGPDAVARGSFDGRDDFGRWGDLVTRPGLDDGGPAVRVVCGEDDPFADAARSYGRAGAAAGARVEVSAGRHDEGFWRWSAPAQVAFLAAAVHR